MARVLVMKPAGELSRDQGVVSHHAASPENSVKHFYNIGDLYVYDSSLRILQHDTVESLDINTVSDERIEHYNANFDYCFLRGSNYINPNAQWAKASEVLERLKIPVVAFGIGVQIKTDDDLALNPETTRLLQQIAAKSTTVAVRGELSVKVLNSIGIKNVRVIGCPTVFRHRHDTLSIVKPAFEDLKRVGFTLRRNTPNSTVFQRYLLHYLHGRFDLSIICAGEIEEKTIYYASKGKTRGRRRAHRAMRQDPGRKGLALRQGGPAARRLQEGPVLRRVGRGIRPRGRIRSTPCSATGCTATCCRSPTRRRRSTSPTTRARASSSTRSRSRISTC